MLVARNYLDFYVRHGSSGISHDLTNYLNKNLDNLRGATLGIKAHELGLGWAWNWNWRPSWTTWDGDGDLTQISHMNNLKMNGLRPLQDASTLVTSKQGGISAGDYNWHNI